MKNNYLLILVGPSAVGKTTVAGEIVKGENEFSFVRSLTTRAPRGDGHDDEYIYTDRDAFLRGVEQGEVLEHTEYVGTLYGTPRSEIGRVIAEGKTPLLILDINGAASLSERRGELCPCIIYLTEDEAVLQSRLEGRYLSADVKDTERYESRMARNVWERENLPRLSHLFYEIVSGEETPALTAKKVIRSFEKFTKNAKDSLKM